MGVFAEETEKEIFPRHTITFDAGMTYATLQASIFSNDYDSDNNSIFLITALQYEYQFVKQFSLACRAEYVLLNNDNTEMTSMTIGAHARLYPKGRVFFLDGMLGYANLDSATNGKSMPTSHFFKQGWRLGWRIDFGKPGGFVLEPSMGWYRIAGRLYTEPNTGEEGSFLYWMSNFSNSFNNYMIRNFFVGGPRVSIAVGGRF